jgi:hypothetical protein
MGSVNVGARRARQEAKQIVAILKLDCGQGVAVQRLTEKRAATLATMLRLYCEIQKSRRRV